jgi:hypothetical protein
MRRLPLDPIAFTGRSWLPTARRRHAPAWWSPRRKTAPRLLGLAILLGALLNATIDRARNPSSRPC